MKLRWAVALLALAGLGATGARASGFGFTVANASVTNNDTNGNGIADVGETFVVTGAPFSSYLSSGAAPAINDNDLNRYTADIEGTATEVDGQEVHYTGTFTIWYTGPAYPTGVAVETGTANFWASYGAGGAAVLSGIFQATQGVPANLQSDPNFNATDFAPYNPGRFSGNYAPTPGNPGTGSITANLNAGRDGFAASLHKAALDNNDANGNQVADVGETFTLTAPIAAYYPVNTADAMLPLNHDDLDLYQVIMNGTVVSVTGRTVVYEGTYSIRFTDPTYPAGVDVETGTLSLTARYNEVSTGAAKLSGTLIAQVGVPTVLQNDPNFKNTDFAVFNPGRFDGTYLPDTIGGDGTVSGTLTGGVIGFSATVGNGTITNGDENSDGNADVDETFTATGPLSAYMAIGAPPLYDKDLNLYNITLSGTVLSVVDTTVVYAGGFTIAYNGPALNANIETGNFTIIATYHPDGTAELHGTLRANTGAEFTAPPFSDTDYAPFNPAVFTGWYASQGATGTFYGSLTSGALVQTLVSRKLGAAIEGSPTAATTLSDERRALVASGPILYVLDPATGFDAPGWEGGKVLDGIVIGRPAVLRDQVFVGTNAGTLYRFRFSDGTLLNSGQPGGAGTRILTAPAAVDRVSYGEAVDQVVVAYSTANSSGIVRVAADNLSTATAGPRTLSPTAITTSSPAVPQNGNVFVGSNAGLFVLDYATLTIQVQTADMTLTSPLVVNDKVWLATGNGAAFRMLNASTGAQESAYNLQSPLVLSAFYDNPNDLVYAGVGDGRILAFNTAGDFAGLVLPGLFNPENTAGSWAMPVSSNYLVFRATENKQILFGLPFNGDEQGTIDLVSAVRGAVSSTGQTPGSDFVLGTSPDGFIHMFSLPGVDVPVAPTVLVDIPMDVQINNGILTNSGSPLGDAIYVPPTQNGTISFVTEGGETFTRNNFAGNDYYYGPYIDFRLAGIGDLDLSAGEYLIEFDTRYFQSEANTDRYGDAPVFVRMYSYADDNNTVLGYKDFSIVYATQAPWNNPPYPAWTHVTVDWNAVAPNNTTTYDPTKISRFRLYGTNWTTPAGDTTSFVDMKNLKITKLP